MEMSMLTTAPDPMVVLLARESWNALKPVSYDKMMEGDNSNLIVLAHTRCVQKYIEAGYDSKVAVKLFTGSDWRDLDDSAKEWHKRLREVLKKLAKKYKNN
jgi:hypothetical protein